MSSLSSGKDVIWSSPGFSSVNISIGSSWLADIPLFVNV